MQLGTVHILVVLRALVAFVVWGAYVRAATGNIVEVGETPTGTIFPLASARVRLVREHVEIDLANIWKRSSEVATEESFTVDCRFWLKNLAKEPVYLSVGFPLLEGGTSMLAGRENDGSSVTLEEVSVDGVQKRPVQRLTESESFPKTTPPLKSAYVWDVSIAPLSVVEIRVRYRRGYFADYWSMPPIERVGISYVTRTGALWAGTIERADFVARLPEGSLPATGGRETAFAGKFWVPTPQGHWDGKRNTITWSFQNWEPDADIEIRGFVYKPFASLGAEKQSELFSSLDIFRGQEYRADKRLYAPQELDIDLAAYVAHGKELPFLRVDNLVFRNYLCRALENEVYARHGRHLAPQEDPFIWKLFGMADWYLPKSDYDESLLNDIERKNISLMRECQRKNAISKPSRSEKVPVR